MFNLKEIIQNARENKKALGHFNISNMEMLKGVLEATRECSQQLKIQIPVFIGLSESERKYIGDSAFVAYIKNWREQNNEPIFINADHCKSQVSAENATRAGFDSVVIDNSELSLADNLEATKKTVESIRKINANILAEGEIGFIGGSSRLLDEIPDAVARAAEQPTTVEETLKFVQETGVDLFAPAVGNIHGVLKKTPNPKLEIERIKQLADALETPLVLHGGSGVAEQDIQVAIQAGIAVVHFSSDLRIAYRDGLQNLCGNYFLRHPDEIAPYRYLQPVIATLQQVVANKLRLLN